MQPDPQDNTVVLEGAISIEAALKANSRDITEILVRVDKDDHSITRIERLARDRRISVSRVDAAAIDERASGTSHGGIIAVAGPRRFVTLDSLSTEPLKTPSPPASGGVPTNEAGWVPWVIMIDGVEDPYNFGSAVRSAYAAGAGGLVVRPRNWFTAAGLVARASAGASEMIPTAIAETAEMAAAHFKNRGYVVACADETTDAVNLYDADLTRPLFVLIGGEKRGITRSFRDQADLTLRIPYGAPSSHSLGTAAATAVIAFELLRQRMASGAAPVQRPNVRPASTGRPGQRERKPLLPPRRPR